MEKGTKVILGVGNELLRDEGLGVHTIRQIMQEPPQGIELIEGGTAPLEALAEYERIDRLVVIDALDTDGEPGAIYRFTPSEIKERSPREKMSLHEVSLREWLSLLELEGREPKETVIIGVIPAQVNEGTSLSPEIEKKIPEIIKQAVKAIKS